jgi:hypothetical protein
MEIRVVDSALADVLVGQAVDMPEPGARLRTGLRWQRGLVAVEGPRSRDRTSPGRSCREAAPDCASD